MTEKRKKCEHLLAFEPSQKKVANKYECEECVKTGDSWVHLRTCQECGVTLCCDSSPNKHASKHGNGHGHPVIISAEPNENWAWCYAHHTFLKF